MHALKPTTLFGQTTRSTSPSKAQRDNRICRLCFEPGAIRRPCCNGLFCDHCYVKDEKCPNCFVLTRIEKLTGATYQLKVFSEVEECRVCLDPGLKRPCCGNYYCDSCFYAAPTCRSCSAEVGQKRSDEDRIFMDNAYAFSVFLGWMVTVFFVVVLVVAIALVVVAENATPIGIFDYGCYGFFRKCTYDICVTMDRSVAEGTAPLPALSTWQYCTLDSEVKLQSPACVYDPLLFHQSDTLLGYDVCRKSYNQGVYIFEDTFDYWRNSSIFSSNRMKSALWDSMYNGFAGPYCGATSLKTALIFRGEDFRYAVTKDLNLSSGGKLEADMFLPPIGYDVTEPFCKTGYIGDVLAQYSTDAGTTWTTLATYSPALYRSTSFFHISLDLPDAAWTSSTRFRFTQPVFDTALDNWALDNVRVLRYLPSDWQSTQAYRAQVDVAQKDIQRAQCCLDTDWCQRRYSLRERLDKCPDFSWYDDTQYLFRLSEMIIAIVALINLLRFLYLAVFDYLVRNRYPFHDELVELSHWAPYLRLVSTWVPLAWRSTYLFEHDEFSAKIHFSARLEEELRQQFDDTEGDGAMLRREDEVAQERKAYEKRLKKQRKRLAQRMGKKNFRASTVVVEEDIEYEQDLLRHTLRQSSEHKEPVGSAGSAGQRMGMSPAAKMSLGSSSEKMMSNSVKYETTPVMSFNNSNDALFDNEVPPGVGGATMLDGLEKMRRQELALLRKPVELELDWRLLRGFSVATLLIFTVLFLLTLSLTPNTTIYQPVHPFGLSSGSGEGSGVYSDSPYEIVAPSFLLVFLAAYNDFKEIYHAIKEIVPARSAWLPLVTVDLTEDVSGLLIHDHFVPLKNISEIVSFQAWFVQALFCAVCFGTLPISLVSLLLRELVITYDTMRYATPMLGLWMVFRAVLGPLFLAKIAFCLEYLFAWHFKDREAMGVALQSKPTLHLAVNTGLGLAALAAFLTACVQIRFVGLVFGVFLAAGAVYGLCTGSVHALPIKPWVCITSLRAGIWMRVRKERKCPCIYWGRYCTDVHQSDEILALFTKDDLQLTSLINNGVQSAQPT